MPGKHTPTVGSLKSWAEVIEVWVMGAPPRMPDMAGAEQDGRNPTVPGAKAAAASRPATATSASIPARMMM